jgi:hypothetical protein
MHRRVRRAQPGLARERAVTPRQLDHALSITAVPPRPLLARAGLLLGAAGLAGHPERERTAVREAPRPATQELEAADRMVVRQLRERTAAGRLAQADRAMAGPVAVQPRAQTELTVAAVPEGAVGLFLGEPEACRPFGEGYTVHQGAVEAAQTSAQLRAALAALMVVVVAATVGTAPMDRSTKRVGRGSSF